MNHLFLSLCVILQIQFKRKNIIEEERDHVDGYKFKADVAKINMLQLRFMTRLIRLFLSSYAY